MKNFLNSDIADLKTFQTRVFQGLSVITIIVLTPSAAYNFYLGRIWLGMSCSVIVLLFLIELASTKYQKKPLLPRVVTVLPLFAALNYAVTELGIMGIFWAYPALFVLYFILERKVANIYAILVIGSLGVVTWLSIGMEEGIRAIVTLTLLGTFLNIFLQFSNMFHKQLQNLSVTDPLTGALNRRLLDQSLLTCISRRDRYRAVSSLISIDLDDFKLVNDRHGHLAGDEVLKSLVDTIRTRTRRLDQLFRTGGDEFLIVLPETGELNAKKLSRELDQLVAENKFLSEYHASISMGVSEIRTHDTLSSWIERCDEALYRSKDSGHLNQQGSQAAHG